VVPHRGGECCTRLENIGVTLGESRVLEGVCLHLHCGEMTVLIGPNGAGKSTLLNVILGEVRHSGRIHFLPMPGRGLKDFPTIGYVPQQLDFDRFAPISVLDLFASATSRWSIPLWHSLKDRETTKEALRFVNAEHLKTRRTFGRGIAARSVGTFADSGAESSATR
jgi:zinc transport system ATP-binding protein